MPDRSRNSFRTDNALPTPEDKVVRSDILGRIKGDGMTNTQGIIIKFQPVSDIAIQYKHPLLPPSPESVTTLRVAVKKSFSCIFYGHAFDIDNHYYE